MEIKVGTTVLIIDGDYKNERGVVDAIYGDEVKLELNHREVARVKLNQCKKLYGHECLFENRRCLYAYNVDGVFECYSPTDEDMLCRK